MRWQQSSSAGSHTLLHRNMFQAMEGVLLQTQRRPTFLHYHMQQCQGGSLASIHSPSLHAPQPPVINTVCLLSAS